MFYSDLVLAYLQYSAVERRLAASTIKCYGPWLRHYARFAEASGHPQLTFAAAMSPVLLKRYLYDCSARKYRPRTIHNAFNALRGLARFAVVQGYLSADPIADITLPRKDPADRPIAADADLTKLMEVVEYERDPKKRARERAMLYVLMMTGVRFGELLDIKEADIDLPRSILYVRHGKGDKARTLYPPADCLAALGEWIVERRKMGVSYDWLWAYDMRRRMGEAGTRAMLEDLKARAGLADVDAIKPHALRRAFATRMLRAGADIKAIQAALGHSLAQTTFMYLGMHDLPAQSMATLAALPAPAFRAPASAPTKVRSLSDAPPRRERPEVGRRSKWIDQARRTRRPTGR